MRKLALVLLLASPAAFAKHYMDNKLTITHDCSKDPEASVMGNDSTITVTGACDSVSVQGNHNTLKIASSKKVSVNGNENTVSVEASDAIAVNGTSNKVSYKKGVSGDKVAVTNNGSKNTVAKE